MGFEVEILALQKATHKTPTRHGRNTTLPQEPVGYRTNLRAKWRSYATVPARRYEAFIVKIPQALNLKRYGAESRNLILSAICGEVATPFRADVFIAHFGPAGVTAAKLRELGVIRGKIATIFHGIDISSREVLNHYTPEYQQLFRRGDLMLPISDLWAGRLQKWAARGKKSPYRAWA